MRNLAILGMFVVWVWIGVYYDAGTPVPAIQTFFAAFVTLVVAVVALCVHTHNGVIHRRFFYALATVVGTGMLALFGGSYVVYQCDSLSWCLTMAFTAAAPLVAWRWLQLDARSTA